MVSIYHANVVVNHRCSLIFMVVIGIISANIFPPRDWLEIEYEFIWKGWCLSNIIFCTAATGATVQGAAALPTASTSSRRAASASLGFVCVCAAREPLLILSFKSSCEAARRGGRRGGGAISFTQWFFSKIFNGTNIRDAFNWSRNAVRGVTATLTLQFVDDGPVLVNFTVDDLPPGTSAADMKIHQWNGSEWEVMPGTQTVIGDTVSVQIDSLSGRGIFAAAPVEAHSGIDEWWLY